MATTKFSDFTAYTTAALLALASNSYVYIVGHNEFTDENIKIPFNDFIATISEFSIIETTLSAATTYQNDNLIDVSEANVWAFWAGQEMDTANLISSFTSASGTITFTTAITGPIRILYK